MKSAIIKRALQIMGIASLLLFAGIPSAAAVSFQVQGSDCSFSRGLYFCTWLFPAASGHPMGGVNPPVQLDLAIHDPGQPCADWIGSLYISAVANGNLGYTIYYANKSAVSGTIKQGHNRSIPLSNSICPTHSNAKLILIKFYEAS